MLQWMSFVDWTRVSVAMIGWFAVMGAVGYAAILVAWRPLQKR